MTQRVTSAQLMKSLRKKYTQPNGLKRYFVTFAEEHIHPHTGDSLYGRYVQLLAENDDDALRLVTRRLGDRWSKIHTSFDDIIKIPRGMRHLDLAEFHASERDEVNDGTS
jgi:hypothetical protein